MTAHRGADTVFLVVIGHPGFYTRFGFAKASAFALRSESDRVPQEAFIILAFDPRMLHGVRGVIRQRLEFASAV